jgi:GNAT superfamily N-acetyltransferase
MAHLSAFDSIDDTAQQMLLSGLDEHALEQNAPVYKATPMSVLAHDESGTLVGGLTGKTVWNWLYIDLLWVKKESRAQGIGRSLVQKAEALAVERGCHSSYLWTEDFDAPDFYPRLGYQKFVVNEDFPLGHQRIGFMKRLAA